MPWPRRTLRGPDPRRASSYLAGSISGVDQKRTARYAAARNRGSDAAENAARDLGGVGDPYFRTTASAGLGGSELGGSVYRGFHLRSGARPRHGETDDDRHIPSDRSVRRWPSLEGGE